MTEKPMLLPYTWCQKVPYTDSELILEPDNSKRESGWALGEKPSHKIFNYHWKITDEYIHHINSWGIPVWDSITNYEKGSVVLYSPYIYQSTIDNNQGIEPSAINPDVTEWIIRGQFLANMDDVNTTNLSPIEENKNYLLKWDDTISTPYGGEWNMGVSDDFTSNIELLGLSDINFSGLLGGDILIWDAENKIYTNATPKEAAVRDNISDIRDLKDVQKMVNNPEPNSVLVTDGYIWKMEEPIIDETQWDKITNKPNTFTIPYADEDVLGGVRAYKDGTSVYFESYPINKPSKVKKIDSFSQSNKITVFWEPGDGDLAYFYVLYRNGVQYQYGITDTVYFDINVDKNTEYFYTVVAANNIGVSEPSEIEVGNTFVQPAPPTNLIYKVTGVNVTLSWDAPIGDYGSLTYTIYRDGINIGISTTTSYIDYNVSIQTHSYYVVAKNKYYVSDRSNIVNVTVI